jgi:hypothetical protein
MRPVAIGRRNWIHIGRPEAGPKVAAIFSVIESCRRDLHEVIVSIVWLDSGANAGRPIEPSKRWTH